MDEVNMAWDDKNKESAKKDPQSWDDQLAAALPQKAQFFDSMRTNAYMNHNIINNFVEFWVALKVDPKQDKWRVMHYMIFDLDKADGQFKAENLCKNGDISFPQAVYELAKLETASDYLQDHQTVDLPPAKYPATKFPELKLHFFDVQPYREVANIEGIAFDTAGQPYRRVEGKVISTASFDRKEVNKSILAVEQARDNPAVITKIEGGILGDIFNSAAAPDASLSALLKVGEALGCMDAFATQVGAFYLGIQLALGRDEKFDKLPGLTAEEKKDLYKKASIYFPSRKETAPAEIMLGILPDMNSQLDEAARIGIHVEPFRKFAAECELYANLLEASQNLESMKKGLTLPGGANPDLIISIKKSVDLAKKKFADLGGSPEQFDRLEAWVASPRKETIPPWLPGFIDRYYDSRRKVMKKVQERQTGVVRDARTMSVKVKPPVVE
jgi:hypothetical protein